MAAETVEIVYKVNRPAAQRAADLAKRLDRGNERIRQGSRRAGRELSRSLGDGARRARAGMDRLARSTEAYAKAAVSGVGQAVGALRRLRREQRKTNEEAAKGPGLLRRGLGSVGQGVGLAIGGRIADAAVGALSKAFGEPEAIRAAADRAAKSAVFSSEAFGRLEFAAGLSGTSIEQLEKSAADLQQRLSKKLPPETASALRAIGVSAKELQSLDAEGQIKRIADGFGNLTTNEEKTLVATRLFGGEGRKLVPLLEAGSEGISKMGAEAERLGLVFDGDTAAAAERLGDAQDRLGLVFEGAGRKIFSSLVPALAEAGESAYAFLDANQELIGAGIEQLVSTISELFAFAAETVQEVSEALRPQIEELWPALQEAVGSIFEEFANLRGPATEFLTTVLDLLGPIVDLAIALVPIVGEGLSRAFEGLGAAASSVKSLLGGIIDAFRAFREGRILDGIKAIGSALVDALIEPLRFIAAQLVDLADSLGSSGIVPSALRRFAGRSATAGILEKIRGVGAEQETPKAAGSPPPAANQPSAAEREIRQRQIADMKRRAARGDRNAQQWLRDAGVPTGGLRGGLTTGGGGKAKGSAFSSAVDAEIKKRADAAAFEAAARVAAEGGSVEAQNRAARRAARDEERRLRSDRTLADQVLGAEAQRRQKEALSGRATGAFGAVGGAQAVRLDVGAGAGAAPQTLIEQTILNVGEGAVQIDGAGLSAGSLADEFTARFNRELARKAGQAVRNARSRFKA